MSASERQERIQLLARKNLGRLRMPEYVKGLESALRRPILPTAIQPLLETDELFELFRRQYKTATSGETREFHSEFSEGEEEGLFGILQCMASRIGPHDVVLFPRGYDYCGAVTISIDVVLRNASTLLELDGDSVEAMTRDGTLGLLLDFYVEPRDGRTFKLDVWGNTWADAARKCAIGVK